MQAADYQTPISSPCTGVCELGNDGLCRGCLRNSAEIAMWAAMTPSQRSHVMEVILPQRIREIA